MTMVQLDLCHIMLHKVYYTALFTQNKYFIILAVYTDKHLTYLKVQRYLWYALQMGRNIIPPHSLCVVPWDILVQYGRCHTSMTDIVFSILGRNPLRKIVLTKVHEQKFPAHSYFLSSHSSEELRGFSLLLQP